MSVMRCPICEAEIDTDFEEYAFVAKCCMNCLENKRKAWANKARKKRENRYLRRFY